MIGKNILFIMQSTGCSGQILRKLEIFSTDFRSVKICPLGAELLHAVGQTDIMKLILAFRKLATVFINHVIYMKNSNTTMF